MHLTDWPFSLALDKAGSNIEARMAMIAMTTSSSIKVKALGRCMFLQSVVIGDVNGSIGL